MHPTLCRAQLAVQHTPERYCCGAVCPSVCYATGPVPYSQYCQALTVLPGPHSQYCQPLTHSTASPLRRVLPVPFAECCQSLTQNTASPLLTVLPVPYSEHCQSLPQSTASPFCRVLHGVCLQSACPVRFAGVLQVLCDCCFVPPVLKWQGAGQLGLGFLGLNHKP